MSDNDIDKNLLANHEYDGIRELDNPLPGWWLITFFATIIFAFLYWLHYDIATGGPSSAEELDQDLAKIEQLKHGQDQAETSTPENLEALLASQDARERGHKLFIANCVACHGTSGEGGIGPNLTDNSWIHGKGSASDIMTVIASGVPTKGMPAWEQMLGPEKVRDLSAFVLSIKGLNISGGKAPEGNVAE